MRICTRCNKSKALRFFREAKGYADGRQRICTICYVEMKREWRNERGGHRKEKTPMAAERQARWKRNRAKDHPSRIADRARVKRWREAQQQS